MRTVLDEYEAPAVAQLPAQSLPELDVNRLVRGPVDHQRRAMREPALVRERKQRSSENGSARWRLV